MDTYELPAQLIVNSLLSQIAQQASRIAVLEATIAHMQNDVPTEEGPAPDPGAVHRDPALVG